MKTKYRNLFWVLAVVAALSFDQLFWQKPGGINFFLFVLIALLGGLIPLWLEKVTIPRTSYLLLAPTVFFSVMTIFRTEPFTTATNGLITLGSVVLFALTLRNGAWMQFNLKDYFVNTLKFGLNSFAGGILFFIKTKPESEPESTEDDAPEEKEKKKSGKLKPYIRGILFALPVVLLFTALLSSADPIFNARLENLIDWFRIDNLGEIIFRLTYIVLIAYLLLGAYYYGLVESEKLEAGPAEKPMVKPFLGMIESGIILGAVNLLFLSFVTLQFTYLFGGTENITLEGFTYSEYARRGFFELVAVAVISLALFYLLSQETTREGKGQNALFTGLGLLLVAQVGVMLVSAHTRLSLYEAVYGFTRLRSITHLFIYCLGILLLVAIVLELTHKMYRLPFAVILFIFGFGLTVNLVNLDRFIVEQNIQQALADDGSTEYVGLDPHYLYTLSYDAIPALFNYYDDAATPQELRDDLGALLACRGTIESDRNVTQWVSWQASREKALTLLETHSKSLDEYLKYEQGEWNAIFNGDLTPCYEFAYLGWD
jgi:uncharacterized membrane protein